jgi:biotin carboxylase
MIGFSSVFLEAVEGVLPEGSIVVMEEPDNIRKRKLADEARRRSCINRLVEATYHQGGNYLDSALKLHQEWTINAVVPGLEYAVPAAAAVAERLALPGATSRAAAILRDKALLREAIDSAGMRNPRWSVIHGPQDIVNFAGTGPVVVKPANRQASIGVQLLDHCDLPAAELAWRKLLEEYEPGQIPDRPMTWRYLAEERLYGTEYSVEALIREGTIEFINVTEKAVLSGRNPVEIGHLLPAPISDQTQQEFQSALQQLVKATGFESGILHAEWIMTGDGLTLVECAGRCPGDRLTDLLDLAYATAIRPALIEILAGRRPELPRRATGAAAIRFISAQPGEVVGVDGAEEARLRPGVHSLMVAVKEGDRVNHWASSWDRSGYALATGRNPEEAHSRAVAAASSVRIRTR